MGLRDWGAGAAANDKRGSPGPSLLRRFRSGNRGGSHHPILASRARAWCWCSEPTKGPRDPHHGSTEQESGHRRESGAGRASLWDEPHGVGQGVRSLQNRDGGGSVKLSQTGQLRLGEPDDLPPQEGPGSKARPCGRKPLLLEANNSPPGEWASRLKGCELRGRVWPVGVSKGTTGALTEASGRGRPSGPLGCRLHRHSCTHARG